MKHILALSLFISVLAPAPVRAARLKDLVTIEGVRDNQLIGYGLVVGLAGTGDKRQALFSAQSLTNMLERLGVSVSPTAIRVDNTVPSDRLAQLEVKVNGKGVVGDAIKRPFILYRLLLGLLPF